jgi:hypothetical protein
MNTSFLLFVFGSLLGSNWCSSVLADRAVRRGESPLSNEESGQREEEEEPEGRDQLHSQVELGEDEQDKREVGQEEDACHVQVVQVRLVSDESAEVPDEGGEDGSATNNREQETDLRLSRWRYKFNQRKWFVVRLDAAVVSLI